MMRNMHLSGQKVKKKPSISTEILDIYL